MEIKKRYSYVINSENKFEGTNRASYKYIIDWGKLPQGRYKVHFTYNGSLNSLTGDQLAFVAMDLGAVCESHYILSTGEINLCILGILKTNTIKNTSATLYADDSLNEAIYLDTKPSNNYPSIYIYNGTSGTPTLFTDSAAGAPSPYLMTIHFDLIE